jgi:hypothetical protein
VCACVHVCENVKRRHVHPGDRQRCTKWRNPRTQCTPCRGPSIHLYPLPPPPAALTQNKDMRCFGLLRLLSDVPEATIGVLVGMVAGLVLARVWGLRLRFSDEVFFYAVLPPIIFCTSLRLVSVSACLSCMCVRSPSPGHGL